MQRSSSGAKSFAIARRWLLPVVALALLAGYGGSLVSREVGPSYRAEAVLVVPPSAASAGLPAGAQPLGDPSDAARLAETYAAAVTANQQLKTTVSTETGVPVAALTRGLTATSDRSTSVITVEYAAATEAEVLSVLTAAAGVLTGPTPPAPISVGTLAPLTLPESAESSGLSSGGAVGTGLVAGLLVALFLAWAVERSDPCADTAEDLRAALPFPVTDWRRPTGGLLQRVVARWSDGGAGSEVSLVGVGRLTDARLDAVGQQVRGAAGGRALSVRTSSSDGRGEDYRVLARTGETTVLVVRAGTRVRDVTAVVGQLAQVGVVPDWALLVSRRLRSAAPAEPSGARTDEPALAVGAAG